MQYIVVGAGLAGLACAKVFLESGREVVVYDGSDDVGGRVRTDLVNGYTLDRGFQVLFDAYPAVNRLCDLHALNLKAFQSGAIVCARGVRTPLVDPRRGASAEDFAATVFTSRIPWQDKVRLLHLCWQLSRSRAGDATLSTQSTREYLLTLGFSSDTMEYFFEPFCGGILLDRGLSASSGLFQFYFSMLYRGGACLPMGGIGTIAQVLAEPLRTKKCLRLNSQVEALVMDDDRVMGVRFASGDTVYADNVVLAVDAGSAARLTNSTPPPAEPGVSVAYFSASQSVWKSRLIALNANRNAFVNNAQMLSSVSSSYAPEGMHLLGASILGIPDLTDDEVFARSLSDLKEMFRGDSYAQDALNGCSPLRVYRIPNAQPAQPPGKRWNLDNAPAGLVVAGDWTCSGSINGALLSGERAARGLVA